MKILLVAHVRISDGIDCHVSNYVSKELSPIYNSYKLTFQNVEMCFYWHKQKNLDDVYVNIEHMSDESDRTRQ